jgi:hypothetical protein
VDDLLADEGSVAVVAVAAYPGDARDVREVGVAGVGNPDGAADDAAVRAVQFGVVRVAAPAAGLDGVEGGTLEEWRVPLHEQEVVSLPSAVLFLPGDVLRGLPAGVGGVGGDHRPAKLHVAEQGLHLGDLGGAVRDPDLPDDHLSLAEHCGEQLDLPVQHAAQPLAVDRDRGRRPRGSSAPRPARTRRRRRGQR